MSKSQIVDKLNKNINWATQIGIFIFLCSKYSYITLNIKKGKLIEAILAPFFACTIPVS